MCIRRIRTAFSALLIVDEDNPLNAAGVQDFKVASTTGNIFGRNFTRLLQLFSNAEIMSTLLENQINQVSFGSESVAYDVEYNNLMTCSRSCVASASR